MFPDIDHPKYRYLLDPCLETVRCFGTEYEASDLAEAITEEVQKASATSTN